jgi:hypothetical protein
VVFVSVLTLFELVLVSSAFSELQLSQLQFWQQLLPPEVALPVGSPAHPATIIITNNPITRIANLFFMSALL